MPLIDKGADLRDLLEVLWSGGAGPAGHADPGLWPEVVGHLLRIIGKAAGPAAVLHQEINRSAPDFSRVAVSQRRLREKALRHAAAPGPEGTIGPLPSTFRFLASGHTYLAGCRRLHIKGREITHINP